MIAPGLQALAFLVGHCWQGQLPTPGQIDRHCFSATADGAIRDRHVVAGREGRVLAGESVYRWDGRAIGVTYRDSMGGRSGGMVRTRGAVFGIDTVYLAKGGQRVAIAARWTRIGDAAYRVDLRSAMPRLDGSVLYRRID